VPAIARAREFTTDLDVINATLFAFQTDGGRRSSLDAAILDGIREVAEAKGFSFAKRLRKAADSDDRPRKDRAGRRRLLRPGALLRSVSRTSSARPRAVRA